MTKQPETMQELTNSVRDMAMRDPYAVVPTLATRKLQDLPTGHRAIAAQSMVQHLTVNMALSNLVPGEEYTMRGQTDQYYLDHDHESTFVSMRASVINLAARNR